MSPEGASRIHRDFIAACSPIAAVPLGSDSLPLQRRTKVVQTPDNTPPYRQRRPTGRGNFTTEPAGRREKPTVQFVVRLVCSRGSYSRICVDYAALPGPV